MAMWEWELGDLAAGPPILTGPTLQPGFGIERPGTVPVRTFDPSLPASVYPVEGPSLWGYSVGPEGITNYRWVIWVGAGLLLLALGGAAIGGRGRR